MIIQKKHPAFPALWNVFRKFDKEKEREEIKDFYLHLERKSKELFAKKLIKEGDSFLVPVEGYFILRFEFYKNATAIYLKRPEEPEKLVVGRSDSAKGEYRFIEGVEEVCKSIPIGIGAPYTKDFEISLKELLPGHILTFEEGASYVCVAKTSAGVELQKTCSSNLTDIDLKNFTAEPPFFINFSSKNELQRFYAKNKKTYTDGTLSRITTTYRVNESLNRLYAGLDEGTTKEIALGPVSLLMHKDDNGHVSWYDKSGSRIEESKIKYLVGFLETSPIKTEFVRKKTSEKKAFVDELFAKHIESLAASGEYESLFDNICRYVVSYKQDLTINMSSFVKVEDGEYKAISYAFTEYEGQCRVVALSHEGNDFSSPIISIEPISKNDFILFCRKKYDHECKIATNRAMQQIEAMYQDKNVEEKDKKRIERNKQSVAKIMSDKARKNVLSKDEIKTMENDIESVLESYFALKDRSSYSVDELVDNFLVPRDVREL